MTRYESNYFGPSQTLKADPLRPRKGLLRLGQAIILLVVLALITTPAKASLTNAYVTQSGAASGGCQSNVQAVSWFNSGANWGSGASQVGPGTTVLLCGTITTPLTLQGSGSNGNPITIQWDAGASLQVCNSSGAIQVPGLSYLLFDLGGNATAIECPNNGTSLSGQVNAIGIGTNGSSLSHTEIRNGTIGPLYQNTCCGSDGTNSVSISIFGGTNDHFHDLTLANSNEGISLLLGNGVSSSGNEINNNSCANTIGRCIDYSNGDGSAVTDTGGQIHDNDITFGSGWYSGSGDYTHLESIRTFNYGGSGHDTISGELIYNNYIHGVVTGDATSYIFIPDGLTCPSTNSSLSAKIFNNLFVMSGGSGPGDGYIFTQDCGHTLEIYDNTIDGGNNTIDFCMEFEGANNVTVKNNICMNTMTIFYNSDGAPTLTADYNDYYNVGTSGANGWYWNGTEYETLAAWKSATGQDAHTIGSNPNVNSDYTLQAGSPVINFGVNLNIMNLTVLDSSKPLSVGVGDDGDLGAARLATGNWDLGAYAFNSAPRPNPPTAVAVTSVQ